MYRLPRRCALRGVYIPIANLVTTITARIRQVTKLTVRTPRIGGDHVEDKRIRARDFRAHTRRRDTACTGERISSLAGHEIRCWLFTTG
jgi:hypothetical protein